MSTDSSPVFDAALSLPETLRSQLADQLLISLVPPQKFSESEWCEELLRRSVRVETGEIETVSGEEALAELRTRLKQRDGR